jgi:hypothetical protein
MEKPKAIMSAKWPVKLRISENARVQEDASSAHLPNIEHDATQLCAVVRDLANLLLRVRGTALGHCPPGKVLPAPLLQLVGSSHTDTEVVLLGRHSFPHKLSGHFTCKTSTISESVVLASL